MKSIVDKSDALDLANKENLIYFEVSAKNDDNIKQMFYHIVVDLADPEIFKDEDYNPANKLELLKIIGKYLYNFLRK